MSATNQVAETEGQTGTSKRVTLSSDPDLFFCTDAASRISYQLGHTDGQRVRLQDDMFNAIQTGELDAYDMQTGALLHLPFEISKPVCVRVADVNDWAKRTGKPWQWNSPNVKTRVTGVAAEALVGTASVVIATVTAGTPKGIQIPLRAAPRLKTSDLAQSFNDINGWPAERWIKNLSSSQWLHPANIDPGAPGKASATWSPLIVAQLVHGRKKSDRAKSTILKALHSRFKRIPLLEPWRDDWNEYFATEIAND
jgi:hypothetical protein